MMTREQILDWALSEGRIDQEKYDQLKSKDALKKEWKDKSDSAKDKMTKSEMKELIDKLI